MSLFRWRDFSPGATFRSTWTDGIENLLSNYVSPNFYVDTASATSLRVPAGVGNDARMISIQGKPRWRETDATVTPSGAAGIYTLWAVATADAFSTQPGPPIFEQDDTDHSFTLKAGGTPSGSGGEAISRAIALYYWDGAAITALHPLVGIQTGSTFLRHAPTTDSVMSGTAAAILTINLPVLKIPSLYRIDWSVPVYLNGGAAPAYPQAVVDMRIDGTIVVGDGNSALGPQYASSGTTTISESQFYSDYYYYRPASTGVKVLSVFGKVTNGPTVIARASRHMEAMLVSGATAP